MILAAALAALAITPLAAQESADSAMRRHRRALGGVEGIVGFATAKLTYNFSIDGEPAGTQTNFYGGDGAFRYVVEGERWHSASFDGERAYRYNPSTRRVRSYHEAGGGPYDRYLYNSLRARALLFPLMHAEEMLGASLMLKKKAKESDPLVVIATYPDGLEREFELDSTGRLVRDNWVLEGGGLKLTFRTDYVDFRLVRGAQLPGRISRAVNGTMEYGGEIHPIDRTEVLELVDAERGVSVDYGLIVEGKPRLSVKGEEIALGGARFGFAGTVPAGDDPESIRAADLNGDGKADLVTGVDGAVSLLPGDGSGGFPARIGLPGGGGSNEYALPFDANGDGILDLAVASTSEPGSTLFILKGLGSGSFSAPAAFPTGDFPEVIEAADFDGDGNIDLAVAHNRSGDARVHFGDGTGSFGGTLIFALGGRGENLAAADLNADGLPDLLAVDQEKLTVLLNKGGREFEQGIEHGAGPFPFCVAAADFDGDGDIDVLVGNGGIFADQGERDFALLRNNGDGTLSAPEFISAGGGITSIALADFNGDGAVDAAAASSGTHECRLLLNTGGSLTDAGALPCGWGPAAVTAADFDGDGVPDLAIANEFSDDISVWLGKR